MSARLSKIAPLHEMRGVFNARRCKYRVAASSLAVLAFSMLLDAQPAAHLFYDRSVHDIYLTVDPEDWATLRRNYTENTYYPAGFTWNNNTFERVGIRSRGGGSRSPHKPNMLVVFDRYERGQRLLGLDRVVLKANNQDASLLHEIVSTKLYRFMGLPASREAPARVFVNGEFFGAYTLVEYIDSEFLRRNFAEDSGYLYEFNAAVDTGYRFEYLGSDPDSYSPVLWEPSNHESDPEPQPIVDMVRTINEASDADFVRAVSEYLDLGQFLTYIATENFLADFDGLLGRVFGMNNFYFYRFAGANRSQFIAWDKDFTFDSKETGIFDGVSENVLARRALQVPELRTAYLQALVKVATFAGGPGGWMEQEIDRLYTQIGEMAREDPNKQCALEAGGVGPCGAEDFEAAIERMREFARFRSGFVIQAAQEAGYEAMPATPMIAPNGVVNAASFGGPVAPGALISIHGDGLALTTAEGSLEDPPVALGDTIVVIDGARAPLLYISSEQINAQILWDMTSGPAFITLFVNGAIANTETVNLSDFAPGIFVVLHDDSGIPVTAETPAKPGDKLSVYATGLGAVDASSGQPLRTPQIALGDVAVNIESVGLMPDLVGVYRITFLVPAGVPTGSGVSLILTAGDEKTSIALPVTM